MPKKLNTQQPNKETLKAIQEVEAMENKKISSKSYANFKEILDELLKEIQDEKEE